MGLSPANVLALLLGALHVLRAADASPPPSYSHPEVRVLAVSGGKKPAPGGGWSGGLVVWCFADPGSVPPAGDLSLQILSHLSVAASVPIRNRDTYSVFLADLPGAPTPGISARLTDGSSQGNVLASHTPDSDAWEWDEAGGGGALDGAMAGKGAVLPPQDLSVLIPLAGGRCPGALLLFDINNYHGTLGRLNNVLERAKIACFLAEESNRSLLLTGEYDGVDVSELIDFDALRGGVRCAWAGRETNMEMAALADRLAPQLVADSESMRRAPPDTHVRVTHTTLVDWYRPLGQDFDARFFGSLRLAGQGTRAQVEDYVGEVLGGSDAYAAVHLRHMEGECEERARKYSQHFEEDDGYFIRMCWLEYDYVRTLVPTGKLFVLSDRQDAKVEATYEGRSDVYRYDEHVACGDEVHCSLIDMEVAVLSKEFVGNPMSTFSKNIAMMRWYRRGKPSILFDVTE